MAFTREKVISDLKSVDDRYCAVSATEGCGFHSFEYLCLSPIAILLYNRLVSYGTGCARDYGRRIEINACVLSPNVEVDKNADISIVFFEVGFPLDSDKRTIEDLIDGAEVIRKGFYILERRIDREFWEELV